jgi:hypothetical protein
MKEADEWNKWDRAEMRVWGKVSGTILGVKPLYGKCTPEGVYIPSAQNIYYGLNDGTILQIYDSDYLARLWPLIGTRLNLAIDGRGLELISEPKFGFESGWKEDVIPRLLPEKPGYFCPRPDSDLNSDKKEDTAIYGRVTGVEADGLCLVDSGCGTIVIPQEPHPLRPHNPVLKVGDYLRCELTNIFVYNLPPIRALSEIPGRLLHDVYYPLSKEHFMYFEVKNGEILYGFAHSFDPYPQKILGKVINFTCDHGFSPYTIERLKEPHQGIFSTYTKYTRDFLSQVYPIDEEEIKVFTVGTGSPGTPRKATKKDEEKDITIFEGILREVPYHEKMLLDTGIGTFLVNVVEDEFAPGDYVKCTVNGRFWISHIDYPVE